MEKEEGGREGGGWGGREEGGVGVEGGERGGWGEREEGGVGVEGGERERGRWGMREEGGREGSGWATSFPSLGTLTHTLSAVILNINMHRKNSKKFRMMQRWIVFCYETHVSVYLFTVPTHTSGY